MSITTTINFNGLTQLKNRIEGKSYHHHDFKSVMDRAVDLGFISKIALIKDVYMYLYSKRMNGRTIHCFKNRDTGKTIQFNID